MENTDKIYAAIARAQAVGLTAMKDGENPFYRSKYATLGQILEAIRQPLADQGLAIFQDASSDIDRLTVSVTTRIVHESGQVIVSQPLSCELRPEYAKDGKELKPSAQQVGSHVTYLRRYSLCAALSIAIEDDDGNAVSSIGDGQPTMKNPQPPKVLPANYRSAHTGETLNTPEAMARHKQAAQNAPQAAPAQQPQQPAQTPQPGQPAQPGRAQPRPQAQAAQPQQPQPQRQPHLAPTAPDVVINNVELAAAVRACGIDPRALDGYLRGTYGKPRITKPLLVGGMTINNLGGNIIPSMLRPENWQLIQERIFSDNLPF